MAKDELLADRARLQEILSRFESGVATAYDEDERGELKKDVTAERITSLRERIADITERLKDFPDA